MLEGIIPDNWGAGFYQMWVIDLSRNFLHGNVPAGLAEMPQLRELWWGLYKLNPVDTWLLNPPGFFNPFERTSNVISWFLKVCAFQIRLVPLRRG